MRGSIQRLYVLGVVWRISAEELWAQIEELGFKPCLPALRELESEIKVRHSLVNSPFPETEQFVRLKASFARCVSYSQVVMNGWLHVFSEIENQLNYYHSFY